MIDQRLFHVDIYNYGKYDKTFQFLFYLTNILRQFYLITDQESN